MRCIIRDRIATALERARPALEAYIAQHLRYPEGFPYRFGHAAVLIREVRQFKVAALAKADHPPVQIEALLKAWLAGRVSQVRDGWDPGILDASVELTAGGTVRSDGTYQLTPGSADLKAWWHGITPEGPR